MSDELRVALEIGPKGKKVVAWAPDWPGLSRGAKTADLALERLVTYVPRYVPVATLAGMDETFSTEIVPNVVDEYIGAGSTDYWGISFGYSEIDRAPMSDAALERDLTLMQAAWAYFDQVRTQVSDELRKGPRGGGRDRDDLVRHVIGAEYDMAWKVGIPAMETGAWRDEANLRAYRESYVAAIRQYHAEGKMGRKWPLHFLIRHTAFHTLDHTWEMEDRDLTQADK
jgi:hypothetical protein